MTIHHVHHEVFLHTPEGRTVQTGLYRKYGRNLILAAILVYRLD